MFLLPVALMITRAPAAACGGLHLYRRLACQSAESGALACLSAQGLM